MTTRFRDLYLRALRGATRGDSSRGDRRTSLASTMEKLYRAYRELPVRSSEEVLDFCRKENLQD